MVPNCEWDDDKEATNVAKHGVSFAEAETAFEDPWAVETFDEAHADHESRARVLGRSSRGRLLAVVTADRGDSIRIITARRATPAERRIYEED